MPKRPSFRPERTVWGEGALLIAGVDEVGRGPLAGPVAAGAVILPSGVRAAGRYRFLRHVNDSKKLSPEAREELAPLIWEHAVAANVAFVSVQMIDRIGIAEASRQAMLGAIGGLAVRPQHLLLDAFPLRACIIPQTPDHRWRWPLAVDRGRFDHRQGCAGSGDGWPHDGEYPGYGFLTNKGYYTPEHARAIADLGPCDLHRRSFSPVKELVLGRQLEMMPAAVSL